ncbi:MAG: hypothetical protein ACREIF_03305 [Chthoniobacterales bacterium]
MVVLALLAFVIVGPALVGSFLTSRHLTPGRGFLQRKFEVGAPIVYRVTETSTCPSQDAYDVRPSKYGESYYYLTNKYWLVEEVRQDGWIVARSPLMEQHYLRRDDPNLRKANLLERLRHAGRFPHPA